MATQAALTSTETNLGFIVEQVAQEKGIDKKILVETIEAAILKAAQSAFGPTRELEARFNEETGQVDLFQYMTVVEDGDRAASARSRSRTRSKHGLEAELGEELGFQVFWHPRRRREGARSRTRSSATCSSMKQARSAFGRIAAQTAKQVLLQRVRDAERDIIFNEYKDRKGELIRGIVRRFEKGNNIIVDLGQTEGVLPFREQTPRETYRPGDRIVAFVQGHRSRGARPADHPLARRSAARREAVRDRGARDLRGHRQDRRRAPASRARARKIAVTSRDADVDPVGACVGMKGSRVQAVVQELRGEKIDIVPCDRDPARYVMQRDPAGRGEQGHRRRGRRPHGARRPRREALARDRPQGPERAPRRRSSPAGSSTSSASRKFKQMEEEAIAALAQIDGVDEHDRQAHVPPRLPRARGGRRGARSRSSRAHPGRRRAESAPSKLKASAETTMERLRQERIQRGRRARPSRSPSSEKLLFVRGVGERTVQLLEEAGYRSVEDILREDEDKLAIKTGLGIKKARAIKQGARALPRERAEADRSRPAEVKKRVREQAESSRRVRLTRPTRAGRGEARIVNATRRHQQRAAERERSRRTRPSARASAAGGTTRSEELVRVVVATRAARSRSISPAASFGRGAHVHPSPECLATAPRGLARASRRKVVARRGAELAVGAIVSAAEPARARASGLGRSRRTARGRGRRRWRGVASGQGSSCSWSRATRRAAASAGSGRCSAVATGGAVAWGTKAELGSLWSEVARWQSRHRFGSRLRLPSRSAVMMAESASQSAAFEPRSTRQRRRTRRGMVVRRRFDEQGSGLRGRERAQPGPEGARRRCSSRSAFGDVRNHMSSVEAGGRRAREAAPREAEDARRRRGAHSRRRSSSAAPRRPRRVGRRAPSSPPSHRAERRAALAVRARVSPPSQSAASGRLAKSKLASAPSRAAGVRASDSAPQPRCRPRPRRAAPASATRALRRASVASDGAAPAPPPSPSLRARPPTSARRVRSRRAAPAAVSAASARAAARRARAASPRPAGRRRADGAAAPTRRRAIRRARRARRRKTGIEVWAGRPGVPMPAPARSARPAGAPRAAPRAVRPARDGCRTARRAAACARAARRPGARWAAAAVPACGEARRGMHGRRVAGRGARLHAGDVGAQEGHPHRGERSRSSARRADEPQGDRGADEAPLAWA